MKNPNKLSWRSPPVGPRFAGAHSLGKGSARARPPAHAIQRVGGKHQLGMASSTEEPAAVVGSVDSVAVAIDQDEDGQEVAGAPVPGPPPPRPNLVQQLSDGMASVMLRQVGRSSLAILSHPSSLPPWPLSYRTSDHRSSFLPSFRWDGPNVLPCCRRLILAPRRFQTTSRQACLR